MKAGFKRAKRGFAQEKKALLSESRNLNFHVGHSILFWAGQDCQASQEQLDKDNAQRRRIEEIEARLEEITVN